MMFELDIFCTEDIGQIFKTIPDFQNDKTEYWSEERNDYFWMPGDECITLIKIIDEITDWGYPKRMTKKNYFGLFLWNDKYVVLTPSQVKKLGK
jgi:hypothetical protein